MTTDVKQVDTSMLYGEDEQTILDHSLSIMGQLLKKHTNPEILNGMSIDKTDGLLRIIDSATKLVNTMATTKIRLMGINNKSDDIYTDLKAYISPIFKAAITRISSGETPSASLKIIAFTSMFLEGS